MSKEIISNSENAKPVFISKGFKITDKPVEGSNFKVNLEEYLTIGQAIDYMLESEENVIEYENSCDEETKKARIIDGELEIFEDGEEWICDEYPFAVIIRDFTKIKKHIEPKQKTLKEKLEAKEPFQYKDNWYRFNKDGAIIDKKGSAIGIEKIKELLTKKGN